MRARILALLLTLLQLLQAPRISVNATFLTFTKAPTPANQVRAPLEPSSAVSRLRESSWAERKCQGMISLSFLLPRHPTVSKYGGKQKAAAAQQALLVNFVSNPKKDAGFPLNSLAASTSAADYMRSGAGGRIGKERFLESKEEQLEGEEREVALFHQRQQLKDLLSATTDEEGEEEFPDMTDEEFKKEVGVSISAPPRAVLTALSKWKKQNPSSPLKPRLHQKWMQVFEGIVLRHLQLHAEQNSPKNLLIGRALRVLLGGSPLGSSSAIQDSEAPSELDVAYSELPALPEAFRDLCEKIREEEEKKITPRTCLKRFVSRAKLFLPLLLAGSLVKRASMTALLAAAGIAGRFMCSETHLSLRSFCLSAGALGAHACLGFLTALCGWRMGGLRHWFSLNGLATGAIIGQWWLASAIYNFSSIKSGQREEEKGSLSTGQSPGNEPLSSELLQQQETVYDDPDLPTAFRDEV